MQDFGNQNLGDWNKQRTSTPKEGMAEASIAPSNRKWMRNKVRLATRGVAPAVISTMFVFTTMGFVNSERAMRARLKYQLDQALDDSENLVERKQEMQERVRDVEREVSMLKAGPE